MSEGAVARWKRLQQSEDHISGIFGMDALKQITCKYDGHRESFRFVSRHNPEGRAGTAQRPPEI
jgi:hypothetical protein